MLGRRGRTRILLIVTALGVGALVSAAPAHAANRFAEVGGNGPEPCSVSDPCSIVAAINGASSATSDDVTLLGGLQPNPYVTSTALVVPSNVTVHGAPGALAEINTDVGSAPAVTLGVGSVLRDVDVEHTGVNFAAIRLNGGGTLERVISHASGGSTSGGCATEGGGSPVIRDSVCWHDQPGGLNGGGVHARNDTANPQTLTLRNVTAVTSNALPGVRATRVDGGALTVNATNVIAQSATGADVGYTAGFTPNAINLDHSNYDTEADPNNVITNPGTGTAEANQTTPPVFAGAGNFHQLPTSVGTIDLGTATGVLMGELDFDGQMRIIGVAPDIGADEVLHVTTTAITCGSTSLILGSGTVCTAAVTDTSAGPITPTGNVSFATGGSGDFSGGGICSLAPVSTGVASCEVTYTPTGVGSHQITGSYPGDSTHGSSQGSTAIEVASPQTTSPPPTVPIAGVPPISFDLRAAIKKCKKKFPKGPKRKKCIKRAKRRAQAG